MSLRRITKKPYTILHTIETGGPGGAETVLLELASKLDAKRFRSCVLLTREGWLKQELLARSVQPTLVTSGAWHDLRLPRAMARLVREKEVDLIHAHLPDQNFYACLVGRLTRCKVVANYHSSEQLGRPKNLKTAAKQNLVRHSAEVFVAVSDYVVQALGEARFPKERIVRIHNGVDMERFQLSTTGSFRAELGYGNGTKLVGMVANLRAKKGYEYFIEAAARIAGANRDVRFVAVGDVDKTIAERMQGLIKERFLEGRFLFTGFRQDVPAILKDLDIFVLSSVSEGFSLATVEAMAAGKPVIATRSGGPEEIIDHGRDGILVPPADADALAREVCSLLEQPDRARELAQAGHRKAATFSLDKMISDYERLYERVLDGA